MILKSKLRSIFNDHRFLLMAVFVGYLLIWSFSNWEALTNAWWYTDDYPRIEQISSSIHRGLINGRPLEGLWFLTFRLDPGPGHENANILIRFLQGLIHCSAGFGAAYLLWRKTHRKIAFVAVLPFLIWPFNAEAVLWRTAGSYPMASFLSILGVTIISLGESSKYLSRVIGAVLLGLAMLANQLAAMAGMVVWLLVVLFELLSDEEDKQIFSFRAGDVFPLVSGYLAGGVLSFVLARHFDIYTTRSILSTDVLAKLKYLLELNRLFIIFPRLYPKWLAALQLVSLISALGIVFVIVRRKGYSLQRTMLIYLVFSAMFVIPYAPLLIVAENWPAFRVLYVAPFLMTAAWLLLERIFETSMLFKLGSMALIIPLVVTYAGISRANSSEYVQVFHQDLATLRSVEEQSLVWNVKGLTVASWPDYAIRSWNPYGLRYMYGDSKLSAFIKNFTWGAFTRLFSGLVPNNEIKSQTECINYCELSVSRNPKQAILMPDQNSICSCPD